MRRMLCVTEEDFFGLVYAICKVGVAMLAENYVSTKETLPAEPDWQQLC